MSADVPFLLVQIAAGAIVRRNGAGAWIMSAYDASREASLDQLIVDAAIKGGILLEDEDQTAEITRLGGEAVLACAVRAVAAGDNVIMSGRPIGNRRRYFGAISHPAPDAEYQTQIEKGYAFSLAVIADFLGMNWVRQYIAGPNADPFLFRGLASSEAATQHCLRVIVLAELLANLQETEGFQNCINNLAAGQVESAVAEMRAGQLLRMAGRKFRFVTPSGVRGCDYDIEADIPGGPICVEAKCKLEDTLKGVRTLERSLDAARRENLPKDRPGAILASIP